jgi:hypothetical protein
MKKTKVQNKTRVQNKQVPTTIFSDINKKSTMALADMFVPELLASSSTGVLIGSKEGKVDDEVLGRERMYRTSIETTPVIASNRIHKNEIESGKRKSFLKQDDVDDLVTVFDTLCVSPNKGMKKPIPISQQHKSPYIVEQKSNLSTTELSINTEGEKKIPKKSKQIWYGVGTDDDTEYGLVEKKMFSSTLNREFSVKRSTRISTKATTKSLATTTTTNTINYSIVAAPDNVPSSMNNTKNRLV